MSVQVIENDGRPEWVVLPYDEYERLVDAAEMMADIRDYDMAKHALLSGHEELIPVDVADRILEGENPIRVWREYRGLSATDLAKACNLTPAAVSQIEKGKRSPSAESLKALAEALRVDVDDLI